MIEHPEGDGMVVGDQMRLRQIVTNLARWVKLWAFLFSCWICGMLIPYLSNRQ